MIQHQVHLPLPPSVNAIWRMGARGGGKVYLHPKYQAWKKNADAEWMAQGGNRGLRTIKNWFCVRIVLAFDCPGDADNRIKGLLDWAQRAALIANDSLCWRVTATRGNAPHGCTLRIWEIA